MKQYQSIQIPTQKITHIVCDICQEEFVYSQMLEFVNIRHAFGYESSYFEDGETIDIDICERCLYQCINSAKNINKGEQE